MDAPTGRRHRRGHASTRWPRVCHHSRTMPARRHRPVRPVVPRIADDRPRDVQAGALAGQCRSAARAPTVRCTEVPVHRS
ncbi:hypothetical protein ACFFX0_30720 [Citricoccus parietis]|uniref:Uncharacterized protein n=1 Tax=Citricoccus parietis TaxID=592307 RepID=A0ABV5G8T3_9MICC